jgi:hypothetical protein
MNEKPTQILKNQVEENLNILSESGKIKRTTKTMEV